MGTSTWLLLLLLATGRPLFYWGARPPVLRLWDGPARGDDPRVLELHAARHQGGLVLRLTFDRDLPALLERPGTPGPQAVVYGDDDGRGTSGWQAGQHDRRRGADWRLEIATLDLGADPDEGLPARRLVTAALFALGPDGRRRSLWRADQQGAPDQLSLTGDWLELRLPAPQVAPGLQARLVMLGPDGFADGRVPAE